MFACVRHAPGITGLLDAAAAAGVNTWCVWPDVADSHLQRYADTDIRITRSPAPLDRVLSQADAVLSNGSANLVCKSLLAGKPLLLVPTDVEKSLAARAVVALGAGAIWCAEPDPATELERFLTSQAHLIAARKLAQRYRDHNFDAAKAAFAQALVGDPGTPRSAWRRISSELMEVGEQENP